MPPDKVIGIPHIFLNTPQHSKHLTIAFRSRSSGRYCIQLGLLPAIALLILLLLETHAFPYLSSCSYINRVLP